jgi:hypothetical protein
MPSINKISAQYILETVKEICFHKEQVTAWTNVQATLPANLSQMAQGTRYTLESPDQYYDNRLCKQSCHDYALFSHHDPSLPVQEESKESLEK